MVSLRHQTQYNTNCHLQQTSIKSSEAMDRRRRWMIPAPLPLNGMRWDFRPVFTLYSMPLSYTNSRLLDCMVLEKRAKYKTGCPWVSLNYTAFSDIAIIHCCYIAQPYKTYNDIHNLRCLLFLTALTRLPLSAPVLGASPGHRQGSVCSLLWRAATTSLPGFLPRHPGYLTTVYPRYPVILFLPEHPLWAIGQNHRLEDMLVKMCPDIEIRFEIVMMATGKKNWEHWNYWNQSGSTLKSPQVKLCLREGSRNSQVSGGCILQLAFCSFGARDQRGYSLQKSEIISVKCMMSCQLPKFLNRSPLFLIAMVPKLRYG